MTDVVNMHGTQDLPAIEITPWGATVKMLEQVAATARRGQLIPIRYPSAQAPTEGELLAIFRVATAHGLHCQMTHDMVPSEDFNGVYQRASLVFTKL